MRSRKTEVFILIMLISSVLLKGQEADSLVFSKNNSTTLKYLNSKTLAERERCDRDKFLHTYKIDLSEAREAKVLSDIRLKERPEKNAPECKTTILRGSVVKLFKYFKKEKYWAAKSGNKWGFLPCEAVQCFD